MSQIYKRLSSSSPLPPEIPTSFVTDSGTAIPVANVLNVLGSDTTVNDADGLRSIGSGNTVTYQLTNRLQGEGSTVGAVTADIITFDLGATPGCFKFHFEVTAFESTTPSGLGYSIEASARTDGITATVISTPDADEDEDDVLTDEADWNIIASGNNIILRVDGVTGLNLNWGSVGSYVFRG